MAKRQRIYQLSKSTIIRSLQCEKSLYLYKNHYKERDKVSIYQQGKFDRGHYVGELAQRLFPGGKDMSPPTPFQWDQSVKVTRYYVEQEHSPIYEAAFIYNGTLVAVDILVFNNGKWDVYEVKSSLRISRTYYNDATIQYYVLKKWGLKINKFHFVFVNRKYRRKGELDLDNFFIVRDVTDKLEANFLEAEQMIENAKSVLLLDTPPKVEIGKQCFKPYPCDFFNKCWEAKVKTPLFNAKSFDQKVKVSLLKQGFSSISNLKEDQLPLNYDKRLYLAQKENIVIKDLNKIKTFLDKFSEELLLIDMEAFQPAVPPYNGISPYENVPFAYVVYEDNNGQPALKSTYFSKTDFIDYREEFLSSFLKATEGDQRIIVYGGDLEKRLLNKLKAQFPNYKDEIENRLNRVIDISEVFLKLYYYHPKMNGGFSLKDVIEIFDPSFYKNSFVKEGRDAAVIYQNMFFDSNETKKEKSRRELLDYCKKDTYALYIIYSELRKQLLS